MLEGGEWSTSANCLCLSDALRNPLPPLLLRWQSSTGAPSPASVRCPFWGRVLYCVLQLGAVFLLPSTVFLPLSVVCALACVCVACV